MTDKANAPRLSSKAKLTKRVVDDASHPAPEETKSAAHVWDTELHGFALKVTPAGSKSFMVDWRNPGGRGARKGQFSIGKFGHGLTIDMARAVAREVLAQARAGLDPNELRRAGAREVVATAFDKVVERFVEDYAKKKQTRSWRDAERTLLRDAVPVFRSRPLGEISRAEINALLAKKASYGGRNGKGAPQQARYLQATLRKLFRWASASADLIPASPMVGMEAIADPVIRDRVLSEAELREVWEQSEKLGQPWNAMVRLLIATGQRRDEVSGMAWEELDLENQTWTIPASRAKNGKAHVVPLNALAMATLKELDSADWIGRDHKAASKRRGLIFASKPGAVPSGWGKVKARLDALILAAREGTATDAGEDAREIEKLKLDPWKLHDLRRTMATNWQALGIRLEVTEAALNHVSGSRAGIVGVYQRHDWAAEKRAAMDAWAIRLSEIIEGAPSASNVVQLAQPA